MRGLIEPALTSPIRFESGASDPFGLVTGPLNAKWKSDVWPEWSEKLAKQYPFAPASPTHAALDEFVAFFRPGAGTFWKFFDASLKDSVVRHNDKLVAKERARVPLTGDALSCLTTAQEITDAVFGTGQDPAVFFAIRMRPAGPTVAEISLLVDGVTKVYRNEPEKWVRMQWPGKEATVRGATVTVRGEDYTDKEERLGAFGFFQLLELGKLKPLPGSTGDGGLVLTASWTIARAGRSPVEIDFRPEKSVHPFKRDFFSRMKCPEAIAPGGAAPP
jgi:type VI protein secretion system component VasK